MREIALDTETTGLYVKDGARIIEIGCVEVIDKKITGRDYHVYINPECQVSSSSVEITGLTNEFLNQFGNFSTIAQSFLDFVGNDRLVIHNAKFDMGFLQFELQQIGFPALANEVIDTLEMARLKFPGAHSTLDALCKRFKVDSSNRTKHGALIDAELLAGVYIHMSVDMNQKDIFSVAGGEKIEHVSYRNRQFREPREFSLNEEDIQNHKKFLTTIKKTLWENFHFKV